ncbi:hypothetical protein ABZ422_00565 [Micromonospora zamorensis]|uniref:hypothetical protein n=1 Tax=Micromonospora zamorensis TaxID=709883 RepID=UPI00081F96D6|nr:hypothetical protein [Micromonospora zamorensis]SCG52363.1 hypothetical protein GA0070619_2751 [Micromonospora zamorensis]
MTNRLFRRAAAVLAAATLGGGAALAAASPAQAATTCKRGEATVTSPTGGPGATAAAAICIDGTGHAWLDWYDYSYVRDRKADGYAARAYVYWSTQYTGAIGVDDTATSAATTLKWESNGGTQYRWTEVWVCLGFAHPDDGNGRCALVVYHA